MPEVVVVDDHSMVRKGVTMLLHELGWAVSAEASSLQQANAAIRTAYWSMMVLDLNLPDGDGLDLIQNLRSAGYKQPILVHSLMPDAAVAGRVFKVGGNGFISKTCEPDEFLNACRKVEAGGRYVSPEYAEELAMSLAVGNPSNPHEKLSEREYKVMCLIAAGKTPTEVASAIGCNVNTISTFRSRILKKLELKTSADIMRYALSRKLVNL
ncbi:response regulator transcription factor [Burkholderia ubonensis]|uniref:response regulator n=1 Tax=Burkholderia ubonensis TaxID=101571 RepID=UPI0022B75C68|nr:response regulator transcription factor [Burkholderia ubonensis]